MEHELEQEWEYEMEKQEKQWWENVPFYQNFLMLLALLILKWAKQQLNH